MSTAPKELVRPHTSHRSAYVPFCRGALAGRLNPRSRVVYAIQWAIAGWSRWVWVLRSPTYREPTSVAGATVEGFPHEVEVAGVAGGFFEQVDEDPAQAHMAVKVSGACGELVEGGRGVGDLT
jgi:hypothetical protein